MLTTTEHVFVFDKRRGRFTDMAAPGWDTQLSYAPPPERLPEPPPEPPGPGGTRPWSRGSSRGSGRSSGRGSSRSNSRNSRSSRSSRSSRGSSISSTSSTSSRNRQQLAEIRRRFQAASYGAGGQDWGRLFKHYDRDNSVRPTPYAIPPERRRPPPEQ